MELPVYNLLLACNTSSKEPAASCSKTFAMQFRNAPQVVTVLAPVNCVCVYICVVGGHGGMHVFAQQRRPSHHLIYFRVRKCARDFCCYNDTSKVQPQPLFMQCCVLYSLGWHTVRLTVSRKNVAIVELDRRWD